MIVIDTSAIYAILAKEEEFAMYSTIIEQSRTALISAGSAIELLAVTNRYTKIFENAKYFLNERYIRVVPVDLEQVEIAGEAYRKYGRGNHPAQLNLGDVFAYSLAKQLDAPLLYKGNDFAQTDIKPVTGYFHYGTPTG